MQKCFFSKCVHMGAKCIPMVFIFATAFLFSGCAEAITGCKGSDILLFFSPVRDFACPEEPTDAVNNVRVTQNTDPEAPNQVILAWDNPAQTDLRTIELRWTLLSDTASEPRVIPSVEGAINTAEIPNGIIRMSNVRPSERMRQSFTVGEGLAYRFRIAGIDSNNNVSLVQQTYYLTAPTNVRAELKPGDSSRVLLTWTPIHGATGYYVYQSLGGNSIPNRLNVLVENNSYEEDSRYTYSIRAVISSGDGILIGESSVTVRATTQGAPAIPQNLVAEGRNGAVELRWQSSTGADSYHIYRVAGTDINNATRLTNTTPPTITGTTYTDRTVTNGTQYSYVVRAVNASGTESGNSNIDAATPRVDSDGDTLIDIWNLDMLAHIRHNLAGTSYKTSAGDSGRQCGTDGTTACTGYELMRDLDFAVAGDYVSGSVNTAWRPMAGGSVVAPGSATNSGWEPIGNATTSFATLFEGNGRSISNLYSRNEICTGLFGELDASATLRNLLIENGNVYIRGSAGAGGRLCVGVAVGHNHGTISNVAVRGGSAHGGDDNEDVGGLVGRSTGTVVASSASTVLVYGHGGGLDHVGGLVGVNSGTVTASYASGAVDGGTGGSNRVGGLVGFNHGTIRASYATGNVNASASTNEAAGGLVGLQDGSAATIIASYATGNVDGGAGAGDSVGRLSGNTAGTITASYAFGTTSGGETAGHNGSTLPAGASTIAKLTMPVAVSPPISAAPAAWNQMSSSTLNAWDFGTNNQLPALRYADYDGSGSTDYCASFSSIPGTRTAITCGTTLLPGQDTLRALPPFDLTVSATIDMSRAVTGTSVMLTATVRNSNPLARASTATTLDYYRSVDNMIDDGDAMLMMETDTIPAIDGGAEDIQDVTITVPETAGNYYYYACVTAQTGETDATNNCSSVITLQVIPSVDPDNDNLIDIDNLDMLNNIRHNLAGTRYKASAGDDGIQCGEFSTNDCIGYELTRDLDFADAGSYASGSVNMDWRPTAGGSVVAPGSATNSGWQPIGDSANPFTATFEGDGYSISNLYTRNASDINGRRTGLFGQLDRRATLRNLRIADSNVYGGSMSDNIGVAAGRNSGTISNVIVSGGSVRGGSGRDDVGGIVGYSNGTIVASSSTAAVYGDAGSIELVGGLVGRLHNGGIVTASYATGNVDGGTGAQNRVGGLVGHNFSIIRASYARGDVNATAGNDDEVGGLVGTQDTNATIIASYAGGNVDGGAGTGDRVGRLSGNTAGTITASYGFGITSGGEAVGNNGDTLPAGAGTIAQLTMPVAVSPPTSAAPAQWNQASSHTMGAWDFGTAAQFPALRYADYDGTGGAEDVDYCTSLSMQNIPGTSTEITCGTTLLPGQADLRAAPAFDLTVSATSTADTVLANVSVTLTAVVRNHPLARPSIANTTLTYYRSTDNMISPATDTAIGTDTINIALSGFTTSMQEITITPPDTVGTYYYYACVATQAGEANTTNNCSSVITIQVTMSVDTDNDTLIDIQNLDMLYNIRHNLDGTSYKTSDTDDGAKCGMNGSTDCTGYELTRDLDFAVASDYASGSVNMDWRPTAGGSIVAPGSATNRGWEPIGTSDSKYFATLFEGNGYTVRNLYSRHTANTVNGRTGLFGQIGKSGATNATLRNLLVEDGNVYGGSSGDHIGVAVGLNRGTISNVAVRGGSAHGGNGSDDVGGLVGYSEVTIIASSASTVAVYGDDGDADDVGGLVGEVAGGTVTASYASGAVSGGGGAENHVGGLAGRNNGTIRASYARGNVNANVGNDEEAGGLVGNNNGTILASYAGGDVDGGAGTGDSVGRLTGNPVGTITASYGFGAISGGEITGHNGSPRPSGSGSIGQMTVPVAANPPITAAPAEWQDASSHTMNAWDFGTTTQTPALRYADYDGAGGTDYCASFSMNIPGTSTAITCGTTLLSGQDTLRSVPTFDLTVSATVASSAVPNTSVTLTAIVENAPLTSPSAVATLTYYSSTDNIRSMRTDTTVGTDSIPVLNGGATSMQDVTVTAPATAGNDAYYYACVTATSETNTSNNCSDVLTLRATDAFGLVAGTQASEAFNFGIQLTDTEVLGGNQLVRQDGTWYALITRPSALFNTGSELYMIANTRDRGATTATQATAQENVPEFYAFDTTNGRSTYSGAFIGSASATTPGVVPYGAAVIGSNLYFVGEKQQSGGGAIGHLYRVPISSGRPTGLAIEVGTLALSSGTEDSPRGLAVAGGNLYLISANGMLHTVRTDTGQLTESSMLQLGSSDLPAADQMRLTSALTASSDGMLHAALKSGGGKKAELYSIDPDDGVMTKIRDISLYIPGESPPVITASDLTPTGLAYVGSRLYMVAQGPSADIGSITINDENEQRVTADKWLFVR